MLVGPGQVLGSSKYWWVKLGGFTVWSQSVPHTAPQLIAMGAMSFTVGAAERF
jgi:hypothetical protein